VACRTNRGAQRRLSPRNGQCLRRWHGTLPRPTFPGSLCSAATSAWLSAWRTAFEFAELTFPHDHVPLASLAVAGEPWCAPDVPQDIVAKDDNRDRLGKMHLECASLSR